MVDSTTTTIVTANTDAPDSIRMNQVNSTADQYSTTTTIVTANTDAPDSIRMDQLDSAAE